MRAIPEVAAEAARVAESLEHLTGWVNDAAVFRDVGLAGSPVADVRAAIEVNAGPGERGRVHVDVEFEVEHALRRRGHVRHHDDRPCMITKVHDHGGRVGA